MTDINDVADAVVEQGTSILAEPPSTDLAPVATTELADDEVEYNGKKIKIKLEDANKYKIVPLEEKPLVDIYESIILYVLNNPFFSTIMKWIRKIPTRSIPTAAISYNPKTDEIVLYWNDIFFSKLSREEINGVLCHEIYHFMLNHLTSRANSDSLWNIATDMAINSIITEHHNKDTKIPDICIIPGRPQKEMAEEDFAKMKEEEKVAYTKYKELIENSLKEQASEFYYQKLCEVRKDLQDQFGRGDSISVGFGPMDDHGMWGDMPQDLRDIIENKVRGILSKAQKEADSVANGWGNTPSKIIEEIRRFAGGVVDWRGLLRQFVGYSNACEKTSTIKRVNKRYPYIHPGTRRKHMCRLAIAIDQSGSVDDASLGKIFAELRNLTRITSITIIPFDHEVAEKDIFVWKRNQTPKLQRVRCGGTNFDAPTNYINSEKVLGKFDAVLIATDGECSKPGPCKIRRGWIIVPNRKLLFATNEPVIQMNEKFSFIEKAA
jgi:predicted metal-dependent peptidase